MSTIVLGGGSPQPEEQFLANSATKRDGDQAGCVVDDPGWIIEAEVLARMARMIDEARTRA